MRQRICSQRAQLLREIQELLERNRSAHADLGKEFARIWLSESKPYALDWTVKRYQEIDQRYADLIGRVSDIRATAERGEPLPAAEQIGLQWPAAPGRRTSPQQVEKTALKSDAPWLEPHATHRLGITVNGGDVERYQLPIELDVDLPAGLAAKPIRAFQITVATSGRRFHRSLIESRDPTGRDWYCCCQGFCRKTKSHRFTCIWDCRKPPRRCRKRLSHEMARMVRSPWATIKCSCSWASEGAHVYEWQLRALDGRDLTMPGTSDWAGFSDLGGDYRRAQNTFTCLAQGPALVRYQCSDSLGMDKTISLFGGCSWMEVTLSDPVDYYWDFDNPQNFAADGPAPGKYLFSNGTTGSVGREADGVSAQVKADNVQWAVKFADDQLALGLATPETAARFVVAPGSGAGGVGIEASPAASHFVTFAGRLDGEAAVTMERLRQTLDLRDQPSVTVYAVESKRETR